MGITLQILTNRLIDNPVFTSAVLLRSGFQRFFKISLKADTVTLSLIDYNALHRSLSAELTLCERGSRRQSSQHFLDGYTAINQPIAVDPVTILR